jgi:eukaryotic-like serine/threonine-protein kinase
LLAAEWEKGELPGMGRFVLARRLGAGGMGVVYEALDRERNAHVALKTLRELDADGIYYLKREFRSLADVAHPNLVQLHELFSVGERWFFTMELVDGEDFLSYVRGDARPEILDSGSIYVRPDLTRLRAALRQLAEGVAGLHTAGKLHRDIKPSNALVSTAGRVVLLDFGLVTDLTLNRLYQTLEPRLAGTPAYLAPEQAAYAPPTPASDWYSVGALLYEALTGSPPFSGSLLEVIVNKQTRDPPPPRALVPSVPEDLEALCMDLLRRQPQDRPNDAQVLGRLGGPAEAIEWSPAPSRATAPWVGRAEHLRALEDALAATARGRPVVVFAHGVSGVGKTALVQRFVDDVARRPGMVVLAGRCFERELVPYRALDSVVDALARYLMSLPANEAGALLPRDTQALVRLFPVLRRADVLAPSGRQGVAEVDPHELRRRGFAALRELLGRIADRKSLVLCIDDLQWGDADSAALLRHILAPPDAPAALVLFSYRREDADSSPCVSLLRQSDAADGPLGGAAAERRDLPVDPLDHAEAQALALALLDDRSAADADAIARECGGNPLFVHALVNHVRAGGGGNGAGPAAGVTLEEVLRARIDRLADQPRAVLEALAVAGRPLTREVANRGAGLPAGDDQALAVLRAQHLVRARGRTDELEIAHDRIRLAASAAMAPERIRETHARLARALAALADVDPEQLAVHLEGAGDRAGAGAEAARAAARADEALAFERAVRLYRWALALAEGDQHARAPLLAKLGDALANLGRGVDASWAYLAAAEGAQTGGALELRRRAAEQLLRVGHLDEGLAALRTVLSSIGVELAPTSGRALLGLLARRARIRLRGLGYRERDASQIAPQALTRLDVFWSVSTALGIIDNVRAIDFQARHLLLALQLGEPYRIALALAAEAAYTAPGGTKARRRTEALVRAAEAIAVRLDRPFARGWATLAAGMAAYWQGRHQQAHELSEQAESLFQGCTGIWWEVGSARLFSLWALFYLGEIQELKSRVPHLLAEAEARGDNYTATNLRGSVLNFVWLADDDPDRADAEIDAAMRRWSREGFHAQHFWHLLANANTSLYRGDAAGARRRLDRDWKAVSDARLFRVQVARIEGFDLRGRTALALAAQAHGPGLRRQHLRSLEQDLRRLRRERTPWARATAALLAAGRATLEDHPSEALRQVEAARQGFEAQGMALHAAVARHREGALRGGDEGARLVAEADTWMRAQGIKNPPRVVATLAPGGGAPDR